MTRLPALTRGDTFKRLIELLGGFTVNDFVSIKFTVRKSYPLSTVVTDTDAAGQVSVEDGGIVFEEDGINGLVMIAEDVTTTWDPGLYVWDMQAVIAGETEEDPDEVYTLARGQLPIVADVTRDPT
jgi:hypothetical protein